MNDTKTIRLVNRMSAGSLGLFVVIQLIKDLHVDEVY